MSTVSATSGGTPAVVGRRHHRWRRLSFVTLGVVVILASLQFARQRGESYSGAWERLHQQGGQEPLFSQGFTMAGRVSGVEVIERVNGATLSYEEFLERFAGPGKPVLIHNYSRWTLPSQQWSPRKLREVCGHRMLDFSYQYDQALSDLIGQGLSEELEVLSPSAEILSAHRSTPCCHREKRVSCRVLFDELTIVWGVVVAVIVPGHHHAGPWFEPPGVWRKVEAGNDPE